MAIVRCWRDGVSMARDHVGRFKERLDVCELVERNEGRCC